MAIRSDFNINWGVSPRIITVAAPAVEVTIQDLYDTCRSLEAQSTAMDDASIIKAAGKEELGGGTSVGLTATLQNALLAFEARTGPSYIQCNVSGGNLVAIDDIGAYFTTPISPTAFTQVVVTASSSATSANQAAIEYGSFNGGVTYDNINGYPGTGYHDGHSIGTPAAPSNNMYDSRTIAGTRGLTVGFIVMDMTLPLYELDGFTPFEVSGFIFIGSGKDRSNITIPEEAIVSECTYENAHVLGYLDGYNTLYNCLIDNLHYIRGFVEQCVLSPGIITLGGGETAHFLDCFSGAQGTETPIIDLGGSGQALALRNYNGGIQLINKNGSEDVSIDLNSGQVQLDMTTVTNGTIVCRGVGKLIDADTGEYIPTGMYGSLNIVNELVCTPCIADGVVNQSISNVTDTDALGNVVNRIKFIERKVYVDTEAVANGDGSQGYPFNNQKDAADYAEDNLISTLVVLADIVLDRQFKNFKVQGIGKPTINTNGKNLDKSEFYDCKLEGVYNGQILAHQCILLSGFQLDGGFNDCGTMTSLLCASNGSVVMKGCFNAHAGLYHTEISMNSGAASNLSLQNCNGRWTITDSDDVSDVVSVTVNGGHLIFDGTCVGGTMIALGTCEFEDLTAGATVIDRTQSPATITKKVMTYDGTY